MKKYYIKDLTDKQAVHAPTEEIAKKLCEKFDELGLKWTNGSSYLGVNHWGSFKGETCYTPATGLFGSKCGCKISDYEILTIDQLYDFDEPLKIEVGKFYKTRGGRKVRIYNTENKGEYPIHGAIKNNGIWEVQSWQENGKCYEKVSQSNLDIVEEWIDELEFDVESLPKWRYIAMDKDGRWMVYSKRPKKAEIRWCPQGNMLYQYLDEKDYPRNFTGSWEDSLHELRDGKLIKVK